MHHASELEENQSDICHVITNHYEIMICIVLMKSATLSVYFTRLEKPVNIRVDDGRRELSSLTLFAKTAT